MSPKSPLAGKPHHVMPGQVVDFDIYAPMGHGDDYHRAWQVLLAPGVPEIVWTPHNGGHWIATRKDAVREVFHDSKRFSSRVRMVPRSLFDGMRMIPESLDPPEHRPYRLLLSLSLSPRRVTALEARMRRLATDLIESFRPNGQCEFTTAFAAVFPLHVFLGIVDLPTGDAPLLRSLSDAIMRPDGRSTPGKVYGDLRDYLAPYVRARRGQEADDLLSAIANGKLDKEQITEEEALMMAAQIVLGGIDTVGNFLSFVMLHLAQNPAHQVFLAESPDRIPHAIEELLRRYATLFLGREVTMDMSYRGARLRKGDMVIAPTMLHGLDDREHEDPFTVDLERARTAHSAFGNGNHLCPGAYLARAELRIALEEWFKRIPAFSIPPGEHIRFEAGLGGSVFSLPLQWDRRPSA